MIRKLIVFEDINHESNRISVQPIHNIISFSYQDVDTCIIFYIDTHEENLIYKYYLPKNTDLEVVKLLIKTLSIFISGVYSFPDIIFINNQYIDRLKNIIDTYGKDKDGKSKLSSTFVYEKLFEFENE